MGQLLSVTDDRIEHACLVGIQQGGLHERDVRESLDELGQLATTAGATIADTMVVRQKAPNPATYIGKGKAEALGATVKRLGASLIVFDEDLTPAQGRNLEALLGIRVVDRTQLILDIFAQHAQTKEGSLQIELAQLEYLFPRLRRMWTHLERQQGGIGLRGPGEKQLEMDRRRIQSHINRLRRELEQVRSRRAEQRRGRRRHGWALLALVGYTNAGKSSLLNSLTGANVGAYGQLFSTLDPTTRRLDLPNNQLALVSDTVGFIKKLPHHLVESFKATLEEVIEADLLLHVIDASHEQVDHQVAAVREVLQELGAATKPCMHVLNKIDLPSAHENLRGLDNRLDHCVRVSARTGEGLELLKHTLADHLKDRNVTLRVRIPMSEGKLIADVRNKGKVLTEDYEDGVLLVEASLPPRLAGRCEPYVLPTDT